MSGHVPPAQSRASAPPQGLVAQRGKAALKIMFCGLAWFSLASSTHATTGPDRDPDNNAWSAVSDPQLWQQVWDHRFQRAMPNVLAPDFIYKPDVGAPNAYTIKAGQTEQDLLGIGVKTKVWGYGNHETANVTFPGRTFEVSRGVPITVNWENDLATSGGSALPHLLPVDPSIMEGVFDLTGSNAIEGVPIAIHHHGGDTAFEFDGGPDQWFVPKRLQIGPGICESGSAASCRTNAQQAAQLNYGYQNNQEASLHWYHDHAEGLTRINVYAGLAGLYVVRDANEKALADLRGPLVNGVARNRIPSGAYELGMVIQDRAFKADGGLAYGADPGAYPVALPETNPDGGAALPLPHDSPTHYPEMFGDVVLVNGVAWPYADVEPREYRVRVLNGSDSRVYNLSFGGLTFWQIGTDLGFLNNPVSLKNITVAPGERVDLVVDFDKVPLRRSNGQFTREIVVTNSAPTPYPDGDAVTQGGDTIMRFNVVKPLDRSVPRTKLLATSVLRGLPVPHSGPSTPRLQPALVPRGTPVRRILLGEGADQYGRITPLLGTYDPSDAHNPADPGSPAASSNKGTQLLHDSPTEVITLARDRRGNVIPKTEVWEFWNASEDSHPIHMHLVQFRVLNRQGFEPSAAAPMDEASGLPMQLAATTQNNGWSGVRLIPAWNQLVTDPAAPNGLVTAPPGEQGWKDTVLAPPGYVTRVLVTFNRPGKFVYHCHILSHEERDMMRWYEVK